MHCHLSWNTRHSILVSWVGCVAPAKSHVRLNWWKCCSWLCEWGREERSKRKNLVLEMFSEMKCNHLVMAWLGLAKCISIDFVSKPFFILFETFSFWSIASEFDRELLFFWGTAAGYGSLQFSGCQFFCIGDCRYVPPKASSKNSQLPPLWWWWWCRNHLEMKKIKIFCQKCSLRSTLNNARGNTF